VASANNLTTYRHDESVNGDKLISIFGGILSAIFLEHFTVVVLVLRGFDDGNFTKL
jgi:hypothetical protein